VDIDDDDRRLPPGVLDEVVEDLERGDRRIEVQVPEDVGDRDVRSVRGRCDGEGATRGLRREVGGPDYSLGPFEVRDDLPPAEDMVAERDDVRAGLEQPVGDLRRDADAVRCVLAVENAEVDRELFTQPGEPLLDGDPAGPADDVGDEENLQGRASVAAGCTSIETWFPASCVYRARAWRSTPEKSRTVPILERAAATAEPTERAGSGRRCVSVTTREGAVAGCTSMRAPSFFSLTM
jgi:hypothetical protein